MRRVRRRQVAQRHRGRQRQGQPRRPIRARPSAAWRKSPARKLTEPKPGVYVFDLGQNIVGWVRLKAKGDAGQKVVVRHAEMLNPDGTIYTVNLRAAKATDTFYLAGGAKRAYEPYFTFHGFQYVEVTGLELQAGAERCHRHRGAFGPAAGRLVRMFRAAGQQAHPQLALGPERQFPGCAHRLSAARRARRLDGRRAGLHEDRLPEPRCARASTPSGWSTFARIRSARTARFGDVAPHVSIVSYGNTGWSDAGPVCNWRMYEMYGDTRVLGRHYDALVRHMDYLAKTSKDFVRGTGAYGDWLRLAGPAALRGHRHRLLLLRRPADDPRSPRPSARRTTPQKYRKLADRHPRRVREELHQAGRSDRRCQERDGPDVLCPGVRAGPGAGGNEGQSGRPVCRRPSKEQDDHLATGFLGTPFVLFALQKAGHPELAYKLVLNKTYPSWLQQVIWGSTTMWERWDGWRPDKGFQDPGMNSFNHYWLGCVSEWLFTQAAGIDTDGPGFKRIIIRPEIVSPEAGFGWVKASYNSIRGRIASAWKLDNGRFELEVTVPGNCTATVYVPAKAAAQVTESGKPAAQAQGVKFLRQEGGLAVFEVGSGQFSFQSRL